MSPNTGKIDYKIFVAWLTNFITSIIDLAENIFSTCYWSATIRETNMYVCMYVCMYNRAFILNEALAITILSQVNQWWQALCSVTTWFYIFLWKPLLASMYSGGVHVWAGNCLTSSNIRNNCKMVLCQCDIFRVWFFHFAQYL